MTPIDHTDPAQLLGTREGITEVMGNLTAEEFVALADSLKILASSRMTASLTLAAGDIQRTLNDAAERIATLHRSARAYHHAQRASAAYQHAARSV